MLPPTTGSINTRMTIDSNLFFSSFPIRGITETRKRTVFLSMVNCAKPSCAMLRSNRSRFFALSFTTAETASARVSLLVYQRDSFPSTRKWNSVILSPRGITWMSLAPTRTASTKMLSTRSTSPLLLISSSSACS